MPVLKGTRLQGSTFGYKSDPLFSYTTLLLPGVGTNGANNNVFVDASTNNFAITRNGNATQGTFSPFSQTGWSNYFDGAGTTTTLDNIYTPSSAALDMNGGGTVECWIYPTGIATGSLPLGNSFLWSFYQSNISGLTKVYGLYIDGVTGNLALAKDNFGSGGNISTTQVPLNTWSHVAWVRTGGNNYFYLNGADITSTFSNPTVSGAWPLGSSNAVCYVGVMAYLYSPYTYLYPFLGYISNFRVVKGTAVYTSAFTPPTAPLTAIANTSLLTCQSNRFLDASTNNLTITKNGDTSVVAFSPFAPAAAWSAATYGGSGYFDGTGDYLNPPNNSAFVFGSGDFTIEAWVYQTATPASSKIIFGAGNPGYNFYINSSNQLNFVFEGVVDHASSTSVPTFSWVHLAVSRASSTLKLFINGTQVYTTSSSTSISSISQPNLGTNLSGYISDVHVIKGTGIYTANFTPPTSPVVTISNTSLLLNFTNAGVYDATGKNNLETVGGVQISTAQSKFGGSSIIIDNADRLGTKKLVLRNNYSLDFGTGDFTIEAWIYLINLSTGNNQAIIASGYGGVVFVVQYTTNVLLIGNYGGNTITGSTALSAGQWYHVAATRSSGTTRLFLNGAATVTSSTSLGSLATTSNINVGQDPVQNLDQAFNGYIQDLRVTKGIARYTANFTPQASYLPLR